MVDVCQEMAIIGVLTPPSNTHKILPGIDISQSVTKWLRKDDVLELIRIIDNNI